MILEALKYPFKEDDWPRKMLFGSLLVLASVLIVPAFTLIGYMLRIMREDSLPGFDNLGRMTIEGIQVVLVYISYFLPAVSILVLSRESSSLLVLVGLFYLAANYLIYSVFYQVSNNGWKAGFSVQVLKNAFTLRYFLAALATGLVTYAIMLAYILTWILVVPILLFPAVMLYGYIFTFRAMRNAIEPE